MSQFVYRDELQDLHNQVTRLSSQLADAREDIGVAHRLNEDCAEKIQQALERLDGLERNCKELKYGLGKAFIHIECLGAFMRSSSRIEIDGLRFEDYLSKQIQRFDYLEEMRRKADR